MPLRGEGPGTVNIYSGLGGSGAGIVGFIVGLVGMAENKTEGVSTCRLYERCLWEGKVLP